jgi:uncharacterized protein YndB with AHSA1/START domain
MFYLIPHELKEMIMSDILHRVVVETSPEKLYKALTEQSGLSAWWTKAETAAQAGGLASFRFGPNGDHRVDMKITELAPNERVVWKCVAGPWVDTKEFVFEIKRRIQLPSATVQVNVIRVLKNTSWGVL